MRRRADHLQRSFLAVAGAADTVAVVSRSTIVQRHTPDALLGRVAAAEQIVGQAGPDLGNLRAGLVAAATSGVTALVSGGLMCMAAVALTGALTPALRRSARTAEPEAVMPDRVRKVSLSQPFRNTFPLRGPGAA